VENNTIKIYYLNGVIKMTELNSKSYSDKVDPKTLYTISLKSRKKKLLLSTLIIVIIEALAASIITIQIYSNKFCVRVVREFENRTNGQIEINAGVYKGTTNFGYFEGLGEIFFDSGNIYNGEWKQNKIEGVGIFKVPLEGTYQGEYSNSLKNGDGTYTWKDGSIYRGKWKDDEMCGKGTYTSYNGIVYEGVFNGNKFKSGDCTFTNETGSYVLSFINGTINKAVINYCDGTVYTGQCAIDSLTGIGKMKYVNGDEYSGNYVNGFRFGNGIYTWNSSDKYDGEWQDDKITGTGKYLFANGSYADGIFKNNSFISGQYFVENDFGSYIFTINDGNPTNVSMKLKDGTTYEGDIEKGELTGKAQITYNNGDTYNGFVKNGTKNGQGMYWWKNGGSYDGNWNEDDMNGGGKYMYPNNENGYKLTGEFVNGVPNGTCHYYTSSTEYYKTDWLNGSCVKIYE
jgi:hypothetical protein